MTFPRNLLFVIGTRPEAIKMAPLVLKAQSDPRFKAFVCFTGQHQEMVTSIFRIFGIKPDFSLEVMTQGQTLSGLTMLLLEKMRPLLLSQKWDGIVVQGDTTSCMVGGLLGFYEKIPVFHVEAGLRSGDIDSPFPEEFNRRVVGLTAALHFPPTISSYENLINEGVASEKVFITGNTGIDALYWMVKEFNRNLTLKDQMTHQRPFLNSDKKLILATLHRRESWGESLEEIFRGLLEVAKANRDVQILLPLHLNPRVRESAKKVFSEYAQWNTNDYSTAGDLKTNLFICDPLDYADFVYVMNQCYLIVTDSGGVQEEAPSLGKPLLVARKTTERNEGVGSGHAVMLDMTATGLYQVVQKYLTDAQVYKEAAQVRSLYGDGTASEKIMSHLAQYFSL